jgi:hypothetical protein
MSLSSLPVATSLPSGEKTAVLTAVLCFKIISWATDPFWNFHITAVESSEEETMRFPASSKETPVTAPAWPLAD